MSDDRATSLTHLTVEEVAAYIDRGLAPSARERVERHVVECAECRAEILAVRRLAPPRGRAWAAAVPLAAAAVLLLMLIPSRFARNASESAGPTVRSSSVNSSMIVAVRPAPGAVIYVDSASFAWRRVAPDLSYRLTLTSQAGELVWSATTSDTTALLPRRVRLDRNHHYIWYVDALLPDGRSVTSGLRVLSTAP